MLVTVVLSVVEIEVLAVDVSVDEAVVDNEIDGDEDGVLEAVTVALVLIERLAVVVCERDAVVLMVDVIDEVAVVVIAHEYDGALQCPSPISPSTAVAVASRNREQTFSPRAVTYLHGPEVAPTQSSHA